MGAVLARVACCHGTSAYVSNGIRNSEFTAPGSRPSTGTISTSRSVNGMLKAAATCPVLTNVACCVTSNFGLDARPIMVHPNRHFAPTSDEPDKQLAMSSDVHDPVISVMLAVSDASAAAQWYAKAIGATEL
jgi:hypothetical protein